MKNKTDDKFNFIRYSNCWEDTDNLLKSLNIENNIGLSILSAGDNTLAMLLKNPKKIIAFDLNPTQIYLFKLKVAGFKYLKYDELIDLLGIYNTNKSYNMFLKIKDKLDKETLEYFECNKDFFEEGIVNIGKFERYFQIFKRYIVPIFASKKNVKRLTSFHEIEEQRTFYEDKINNRRFKAIFNIYFGFKVMGNLGRDTSFYDYVEDKENSSKNIKQIFDYGITHIPSFNNPYINYILLNKFNNECLPVYLRRENFEIIRNNIDKIKVVQSDLIEISGKYDFYNLSDIFEYMSEKEFEKNIDKIKQISNNNAMIAYYNMQNIRYINSKEFEYQKELSDELTKTTKSYFYRDFVIYKFGENMK